MTRPKAIIALLTIIAAVSVLGVVYDTLAVFHLSARLDNTQGVQAHNRASNVGVWCGAIDSLQNVLVAYVAGQVREHPDVPALRLTALPCKQLEQATLTSAK